MPFDFMPLSPSWEDVGLRLLLTVLGGIVIGLDRGARGHAAGMRTTILVALAASVAMIQANVLLSVGGKQHDSFGVMDLMRLPLGILTGIGFIGAGAILRRGDLVTGVTTAASLWVMTVIGLCFGGGQLGLGIAATALTLITLRVVKWVEVRIPREQHAILVIKATANLDLVTELAALIEPFGYEATLRREITSDNDGTARFWFDIWWLRPEVQGHPLELMKLVNNRYAVTSLEMISQTHHQP